MSENSGSHYNIIVYEPGWSAEEVSFPGAAGCQHHGVNEKPASILRRQQG
jgi:hypothetical protein